MKLRIFSIFALTGLLLSSCAVEEVPVTVVNLSENGTANSYIISAAY